MPRVIEELFVELDRAWKPAPATRVKLCVLGAGALMLLEGYERGTKDGDIFETLEITDAVRERLLLLAGPHTDIHRRLRVYIDVVRNGIPLLPNAPMWRDLPALDAKLASFTVKALDATDVIVSKLKRFSASDVSDADAMIRTGVVSHDRFVERFRSAIDTFAYDARADDIPEYVSRFHRVERDMFEVDETEIELPSWI